MTGAGLLAKARTMDHQHVPGPAQFLDENVIAFRDVDARESVERAAGRHTAQARGCLAPFHSEIAAGAKLVADFHQVLLWPVQRGLDSVLFGMVGAQARAQKTMNAFHVGSYGGPIAADHSPSNAPAGR